MFSGLSYLLNNEPASMDTSLKWSQRLKFRPGVDSLDSIEQKLGCHSKAGIYLIQDEDGSRALYVGRSRQDVERRLKAHLQEKTVEKLRSKHPGGNRGIADLILHKQTLSIQWIGSSRPVLSESVAIALLQPLLNQEPAWAGWDKATINEIITEAKRLELTSFWKSSFQELMNEAKSLSLPSTQYSAESELIAQLLEHNKPALPEHLNLQPKHQDFLEKVNDWIRQGESQRHDLNQQERDNLDSRINSWLQRIEQRHASQQQDKMPKKLWERRQDNTQHDRNQRSNRER